MFKGKQTCTIMYAQYNIFGSITDKSYMKGFFPCFIYFFMSWCLHGKDLLPGKGYSPYVSISMEKARPIFTYLGSLPNINISMIRAVHSWEYVSIFSGLFSMVRLYSTEYGLITKCLCLHGQDYSPWAMLQVYFPNHFPFQQPLLFCKQKRQDETETNEHFHNSNKH